ncbi:unnamed protein product [Ambrosiozyma monospora]|uniref:Unnamed protein product n=1 Tax=Ambrosiozyma monospora TaxID=43982 RepID=A0ACB5SV84_AMBMO|nr:unnamed protein product [Ambrosiozyma monospora]
MSQAGSDEDVQVNEEESNQLNDEISYLREQPQTTQTDNSNDSALAALGVRFMEQDSLERKVAADADKMIVTRDIELDEKRLEKAKSKYNKLEIKLKSLQSKLNSGNTRISVKQKLRLDIENLKKEEIDPLLHDIKEITERLSEAKQKSQSRQVDDSDSTVQQLPSETKKEFLIRTGKITAFGSANGFFEDQDANDHHSVPTHRNLMGPGLEEFEDEEGTDEIQEINSDEDLSEESMKVEDDDDVLSDDDVHVLKKRQTKRKEDDNDYSEDDADVLIDSEED